MTTDYDRVLPSWYWPRDAVEDDGLTEDGSTQDVADGAVGALPHLLEFELLHPGLVGGDCRTLNADLVLQNCFCRFDSNFVVSL